MPPDLHILHLEPDDDSVTIRDRLTFVRARRVLLVWPASGTILPRKLDLLLVLRQATRLGMRLALVTADRAVIEHARDLRISVFASAEAAQRATWHRPRERAFIPPHDDFSRAELADAILHQRASTWPAPARRYSLLRWIAVLASALALALAFFVAAPSATITLTPASRQVFETVQIVADPTLADIDLESRRMPAAVVSLQASSRVTVASSGRESAGATQAQGLVTFTNLSGGPLLVPYGTVIATSDTYPVRFETVAEAMLPSGDQAGVPVPIRALPEHSGTAGNVSPGAINRVEGDLAGQMAVTNLNATFGGALQERSIVTAADHQRLLVLGRQQVLQRARDTLLHQLTGEQFLVPGSIAIRAERPEWTVFNAYVGDAAESVSLDLRADVQAVIVDERQARQVAFASLAPYVQPGLEIAPEALSFARGDILDIAPDGRVTFVMTVSGSVAVAIDQEYVRARTRGVSVGEARRRLEGELLLDPGHPPRIATWPGWYPRMPVLPVRIAVEVRLP
jgi:hypothetical protein